MSEAPVLEAHGLAKSFRVPSAGERSVRRTALGLLRQAPEEELRVLEEVTLQIRDGEAVGLMGRNGSGKSTLLKILCGIYRPDRGRVVARDAVTPVLELGLGWNPSLDAVDNILLLGTVMGRSLREVEASVDGILDFAGLARFARLPVKHYSSGMAARLAYAVAFAAPRGVLLLDEIFAVGDAEFRARCEARYRALRAEGRTVILVSHDPWVVTTFCDRALLLEGGRIARDGEPGAVTDGYLALLASRARPAEGMA